MAVVLQGTYRNGRVELKDNPAGLAENSPVLVTISTLPVDLGMVGISPKTAAELRAHMAGFAEEWDSPEMEVYDDYDAAQSAIQAR